MNKKHLNYLMVILLLLTFSVSKAQEAYQPGYAILNDGTRISGSIILYDEAPWFNQRFIFLKDSAQLANDPNTKAKKYKVADLKFYQVGARAFDKVHFVDSENLQVKSFGANDHMLERLASGRIQAHRFYSYETDIDAFMGTEQEYQDWKKKKTNDLFRGYKILIKKDGEGKVKNAFDADLQKYFEDTPEVLAKYKSGGYGNEPIVAKKGLAAKMIALAKKAAFKPQEADAMVLAFNDYNEKNATKK